MLEIIITDLYRMYAFLHPRSDDANTDFCLPGKFSLFDSKLRNVCVTKLTLLD